MGSKELFNDLNLVVRLHQHIQEVSDLAGSSSTSSLSRSNGPASLPRQSSFKVLADLESISTPDPRDDARFAHQRAAFAAVDSSNLPFHLQGDSQFNEGAALAKRRALRFAETIRDKILFLWEVARGQKNVHAVAVGTNNGSGKSPAFFSEIDEEAYMTMMLLIFKVLRDDFSLDIARKQIQCDWDVDSHHGQTLSFEQFFSAMFELVDMWTCDTEEPTYVRFLELLLRRITVRVVVFLDNQKLHLALSDNFDEAVVVKAIPLHTISRFASVAKLVAPRGVRTIGELANADPVMVEQERVAYITKNAVSGDKIGQELQELLSMFRSLASKFDNADYSLVDNILRRHMGPKGSGVGGVDGVNSQTIQMTQTTQTTQTASLPAPTGAGGVSADPRRRSKSIERGPHDVDLDILTRPNGSSSAGPSDPSVTGRQPASRTEPYAAGHVGSHVSVLSQYDSIGPTWSSANDPTRILTENGGSGPTFPETEDSRQSGRRRLNSIHDISVADANLVTAVKTSFLIEKSISLERQTETKAIRQELRKFGVEQADTFDEDAARRQYARLYELFVVRDGDNLKALAHAMLEQIKVELAAHGIIVDDDADAEAVYDQFYGSIVAGTGETIVADAKQWVETTIATNSGGAYVKSDYHEFKPIDEVALLGTQSGDEEFMALVPNDEEGSDEEINPEDKPQLKRHPSSLSVKKKPSRRKLAKAISKRESSSQPQTRVKTVPGEILVESDGDNEESPSQAQDDGQHPSHEPSKRKRSRRKKMGIPAGPSQPLDAGEDTSPVIEHLDQKDVQVVEPSVADNTVVRNRRSVRPSSLKSHTDAANEDGQSEQPPAEENGEDNFSETNDDKETPQPQSLPRVSGPKNEDDDAMARQTHALPPPSRSKVDIDTSGDLGDTTGHHMGDSESVRDPQGVDFGFEQDAPAPPDDEMKPEPIRSVNLEPKVPQIVVASVAGSSNMAATGRYIQLLGLGTVTTASGEAALLQLLASDAGSDTDLVCFDVGSELGSAQDKLNAIQRLVGKCVILIGGGTDQSTFDTVAAECLNAGAIYFAQLPIDFPQLREQIYAFFESSTRPYILRSRKPTGRSNITFQSATRTIGAAGMFALQDQEPSRKLSTTSAAVAHSAKNPLRKLSVTIPGLLPSLTTSPAHRLSVKVTIEEARAPEFVPTIPLTPRSLKSYKKSPRLSAALNKLIR